MQSNRPKLMVYTRFGNLNREIRNTAKRFGNNTELALKTISRANGFTYHRKHKSDKTNNALIGYEVEIKDDKYEHIPHTIDVFKEELSRLTDGHIHVGIL